MSSSAKVVPKARRNVHTVIIDWFSRQSRGAVLDAPAGYGHLSQKLSELGFSVVAGEIEPEHFHAENIQCIYTDLNNEIHADDASFDYICCVDGLEHMTNPYRAIEEFARVLKPGGIAVFSIPNYSNIQKRFLFLSRGFLIKPKSLDDYYANNKNLYNFHNTPLTITLLEFMFSINGLTIEEIHKDKVKRKQYFFYPIVLVFKIIAWLSPKKKRLKYRFDLTLRNDVIFGGNALILITRKNDVAPH